MEARTNRAAIPAIDLGRFLAGDSAYRRSVGGQVDKACRETGFLAVANHGVNPATVARAWRAAAQFFDRPLNEKLAIRSAHRLDPRGYFPVDAEALSRSRGMDSPPDPKESFSCGPLQAPAHAACCPDREFFYGPNRWPVAPGDFRDAWVALYRAMESLGGSVMRLFAVALGLPDDWFAACHRHHVSALRALNYPAADVPLPDGQHRAGPHSDYGSVTILIPDRDVGGLEIRLPSGEWIAAPGVGDGFLVNIGDLLMRWTNDRWASTLHRVVAPPADAGGHIPRRQSIAWFQNPDFDAVIAAIPGCVSPGERPRYQPVAAGEYLVGRFSSAV